MKSDQLRQKVQEFVAPILGNDLPFEINGCTEDSFEVIIKDGMFNTDRKMCWILRPNIEEGTMEMELGEDFVEVDEIAFLRHCLIYEFVGDLMPEI